MALDPALGEAHASLAQLLANEDWNFGAAEREFKRAIELSPSYIEAHHMYSHYLLAMGRNDESLVESRKVLALDPLSPVGLGHLAYHYLSTPSVPDEAISTFQTYLAKEKNDVAAYAQLGDAYYQKGMMREAFEQFLTVRRLDGAAPRISRRCSGLTWTTGSTAICAGGSGSWKQGNHSPPSLTTCSGRQRSLARMLNSATGIRHSSGWKRPTRSTIPRSCISANMSCSITCAPTRVSPICCGELACRPPEAQFMNLGESRGRRAVVVTDALLPRLNELVHTSLAMTTVAETLRRVTQQLAASGALMAWEVVPRDDFGEGLPRSIRSCWIFVIRAGATTGAERHPNSHQRSFSLIGSGTFELRDGPEWRSHPLASAERANLEQRWVSIPASTWHRLLVGSEPWGMPPSTRSIQRS